MTKILYLPISKQVHLYPNTVCKINEYQLGMLDDGNCWESDLAALSILSDSMAILTKSLKSSNNEQEATVLKKIIKKLSKVCVDTDSHTTIKFIALNGLGNLFFPTEADTLLESREISVELLKLFLAILR